VCCGHCTNLAQTTVRSVTPQLETPMICRGDPVPRGIDRPCPMAGDIECSDLRWATQKVRSRVVSGQPSGKTGTSVSGRQRSEVIGFDPGRRGRPSVIRADGSPNGSSMPADQLRQAEMREFAVVPALGDDAGISLLQEPFDLHAAALAGNVDVRHHEVLSTGEDAPEPVRLTTRR